MDTGKWRTAIVFGSLAFFPTSWSAHDLAPKSNALVRIHDLDSEERVFAYSRISPDGRLLAYTSERQRRDGSADRMVKVINIQTKSAVFAESGIDPYWSPAGDRLVFISHASDPPTISIVNIRTRQVRRNIASVELGDYPSWGRSSDGGDVLLTIKGNYFLLNQQLPSFSYKTIPSCADLGRAERPLISKDGRRVTSFQGGRIVVRPLDHCGDVIRTGISGAKADFSRDGRFIAFHTFKASGKGYEVRIADLAERNFLRLAPLPGSSYFPSWADDGRLAFRYESEGFHGFVLTRPDLSSERFSFPSLPRSPEEIHWADVFTDGLNDAPTLSVVMVWAPWISHSPDALRSLQRAATILRDSEVQVQFGEVAEPASAAPDVEKMRKAERMTLDTFGFAPNGYQLTFGHNQLPVTLLFRDGVLEERRLGAQTAEELVTWVIARAIDQQSSGEARVETENGTCCVSK